MFPLVVNLSSENLFPGARRQLPAQEGCHCVHPSDGCENFWILEFTDMCDFCIIFKTCISLIFPSILLPGDRRGRHLDHQDVHHLEDYGAQVQGEEHLSETTPHNDVWQRERQRYRRPQPWRPWSSSSRWRRKTYTWLLSAHLDYHWSGSLAII